MVTKEVDTAEDLLLATGLIGSALLGLCTPVVLLAPFIYQCNLGPAALIFPTCESKGDGLGRSHNSLHAAAFWSAAQWLAYTLVMQQLFAYFILAIVMAVIGLRV